MSRPGLLPVLARVQRGCSRSLACGSASGHSARGRGLFQMCAEAGVPFEHDTDMKGFGAALFGMEGTCAKRRAEAIARYLKKRKDRNFEKKVRYASRKRLAEARPRIRGQFVRLKEGEEFEEDEDEDEADGSDGKTGSASGDGAGGEAGSNDGGSNGGSKETSQSPRRQ